MSKSSQEFYDQYHAWNHNAPYQGVIRPNNFTYWYILPLFQQALKGKQLDKVSVLDVGCGVGTLSLFLGAEGAKVVGVDISPQAVQIAKAAGVAANLGRVKFEQGELQKGKQNYDLVVCSEIIEHVPDQNDFLKKIYSNLKSDGKLVLTTPSRKNVLYRLGFYKGFDAKVGHLRRYTENELQALLEKHGFQVTMIRGVEGPLRNILFTTPLGFFIRGIKGPLIPLFHFFDEISVKIFGASDIQVIAQRA